MSLWWALMQYDRYPCKMGASGHRHTQEECHVRIKKGVEVKILQAKEQIGSRSPEARQAPWNRFSLRTSRRIHSASTVIFDF